MQLVLGTAYYIAPEVLTGNYDEKCDVWSIGVILFILLSGSPPFGGQNDEEIMKKVEKGKYAYAGNHCIVAHIYLGDVWKKHSKLVKDFISALMEFSPEKRLTAKEALEHEWIKKSVNMDNVDTAVTAEAFKNLSKFRVIIRKQLKILSYSPSKSYSKPH